MWQWPYREPRWKCNPLELVPAWHEFGVDCGVVHLTVVLVDDDDCDHGCDHGCDRGNVRVYVVVVVVMVTNPTTTARLRLLWRDCASGCVPRVGHDDDGHDDGHAHSVLVLVLVVVAD